MAANVDYTQIERHLASACLSCGSLPGEDHDPECIRAKFSEASGFQLMALLSFLSTNHSTTPPKFISGDVRYLKYCKEDVETLRNYVRDYDSSGDMLSQKRIEVKW